MAIPRPIGPPARMDDVRMMPMPPNVRHAMGGGSVQAIRLGGWGTVSPKGLQTSVMKRVAVAGPHPFHGTWMSSLHPRGHGGKFMGRGRRMGRRK